VDQVWEDLAARGTDMVVITGGEPLLQQVALAPLLRRCRETGWRVEIETAGTVTPSAEVVQLVDQFNVSPKLENSGNHRKDRYRPDAIDALGATGKATWKFVLTDAADIGEVAELVDRHRLQPVYVMPEGVSPDVVKFRSEELVEAVLAQGWNLTTRLHVLIYGNRRGV
jgi:organic radical activating enzyme